MREFSWKTERALNAAVFAARLYEWYCAETRRNELMKLRPAIRASGTAEGLGRAHVGRGSPRGDHGGCYVTAVSRERAADATRLPVSRRPRRMTRRGFFVSRRLRRMTRRGLFVLAGSGG